MSGDLDLDRLVSLDDAAVRAQLMQVKGIGRWTADIYLLMALLRPDVWPAGDLALVKAMQKVKRLPAASTADEVVRNCSILETLARSRRTHPVALLPERTIASTETNR